MFAPLSCAAEPAALPVFLSVLPAVLPLPAAGAAAEPEPEPAPASDPDPAPDPVPAAGSAFGGGALPPLHPPTLVISSTGRPGCGTSVGMFSSQAPGTSNVAGFPAARASSALFTIAASARSIVIELVPIAGSLMLRISSA